MPEKDSEQITPKNELLIVELGEPFQIKPDFEKIDTFFRNDMVIVNPIPFVIPGTGKGKVIVATFLQEISSLEQRSENNVVTPLGELDFTIDPYKALNLPYALPVTIYLEADTDSSISPRLRYRFLVNEKVYYGGPVSEELVNNTGILNRSTVYNWLDPDKQSVTCSPYFPATREAFSQISFVITSE